MPGRPGGWSQIRTGLGRRATVAAGEAASRSSPTPPRWAWRSSGGPGWEGGPPGSRGRGNPIADPDGRVGRLRGGPPPGPGEPRAGPSSWAAGPPPRPATAVVTARGAATGSTGLLSARRIRALVDRATNADLTPRGRSDEASPGPAGLAPRTAPGHPRVVRTAGPMPGRPGTGQACARLAAGGERRASLGQRSL